MTDSSLTVFSFLFVVFSCSCGEVQGHGEGDPGASRNSERHILYDSLRLAENQEIYIGRPLHLVVVPVEGGNGRLKEIWLSDWFSNSVLQFDGDGDFVRRIGQPGPGPHEFSSVTMIFLPNPDEVGAVDFARHEIKWFDRESGELRRFIRHEPGNIGWSGPLSLDAEGSKLFFPLLSVSTLASLDILDLESETWTRTGPFPAPLRLSLEHNRGAFAGIFGHVFLDRLSQETALVAFTAVDTIYEFDLHTQLETPLGKLPRLRRRGVENECALELIFGGNRKNACEGGPTEHVSCMTRMRVLNDGRIAVVHADYDGGGVPPPRRAEKGTGYLSVMDRNEDLACVDVAIPGGDDNGMFVDIAQGVLYALDRRIKGDSLESWLLEIPIPSLADCPEGHLVQGWIVKQEPSGTDAIPR